MSLELRVRCRKRHPPPYYKDSIKQVVPHFHRGYPRWKCAFASRTKMNRNKLGAEALHKIYIERGMQMISVGIDTSKGKSTVCVLKPGGEVLKTPFEMLHTMEGILSLVTLIRSYYLFSSPRWRKFSLFSISFPCAFFSAKTFLKTFVLPIDFY